jgi:uncharacterized membrane protein
MDATVQQERARDFDRFLTFLDAIVAIAVTLLVLPLVDLVGELENDSSVLRLLQDHKAPIGAFLSFLVISQLWLIQHRMLRNVVATTDLLTGLLLAWALTVVVLPFPTALVAGPGDAGGQAITKIVYVGTMAVGSLVLGLVCLVIGHDDGLRDSADAGPGPRLRDEPDLPGGSRRHAGLTGYELLASAPAARVQPTDRNGPGSRPAGRRLGAG